jgi:acetyltransferase-like isoleucine patch superfamily enzyme
MKFSQLKRRLKQAYLVRRFGLTVDGDAFEIGKHCIIRRNNQARIILGHGFCARHFISFNVSGTLRFGQGVFVNSYTSFNARDSIFIDEGTLIGEGVRFYDHDHDFRHPILPVSQSGFNVTKIHVGKHVWIGANVIILRGVTIGDGAVVAAGAVVSRDIPDRHIYFSRHHILPIDRAAQPAS